jgi:hypothetical protein
MRLDILFREHRRRFPSIMCNKRIRTCRDEVETWLKCITRPEQYPVHCFCRDSDIVSCGLQGGCSVISTFWSRLFLWPRRVLMLFICKINRYIKLKRASMSARIVPYNPKKMGFAPIQKYAKLPRLASHLGSLFFYSICPQKNVIVGFKPVKFCWVLSSM